MTARQQCIPLERFYLRKQWRQWEAVEKRTASLLMNEAIIDLT